MPPRIRARKKRAYTPEEIQRSLDAPDERICAAILLLASTGMTIKAIPYLNIESQGELGLT